MAEPVAEQILAAMVARLQQISGVPGGVSRVFRWLDQVNELPCFLVLPSAEENTREYGELGGGVDSGLGGTIRAWMGVEVLAYARGTDLEPVTRLLLRLLAAAETALTSPDLHLGLSPDVVSDVQNTGRVAVLDLEFPDEGFRGAMSHVYRVAYDYIRAIP